MRRILTLAASAVAAVGLYAAPASADPPTQEGLVNVNLSDNTVQVPVAAAVNICDVNVAALAEIVDEAGSCDAVAGADARQRGENPGSPVSQDGLINVNVSGNTIQVPVAVAANICDVNVAVLAELADEGGSCDAQAGSQAQA
jgi:hypothetical protein